jgi:hypothetical protein
MLQCGIIEVKLNSSGERESYFPHKWTKLYRIVPKWIVPLSNGRSYRREKITHKDVLRAVARHYAKNYERQLKSLDGVYADITRFSERFSVDTDKLEQDVQDGKLDNGEDLLAYALAINDDFRYVSKCRFGNRLHTHLGNMPKQLRPYLVLDGNQETTLYMADVKSSQAYCLALLFYKPELLNLVPEFLPTKYKLEQHRADPATWMLYNDCCKGVFYQRCLTALSGTDAPLSDDTKKNLKELLFTHVFFSSAGNYHKSRETKTERQEVQTKIGLLYPSLLKNLYALKRTHRNELPFVYEHTRRGKKAGRMYTTPSMMAQRFESKILLQLIAATMFSMGMPVFTIHDAFILESSNLETLKQVFEQVFREQLGMEPPQLHITRLTTERQ